MTFDRSKKNIFSTWWWTVDRMLLVAIGLVICFGILMVTTASPAIAERIGLDSFYFVKRQLAYLGLGIGVMLGVSLLPVVGVRRLGIMGFGFGILALLAVLILGENVNGAKRWLSLGGFSLQPSEFMKPLFVIFTAWILSLGKLKPGFNAFGVSLATYIMLVTLLVLQPDFGMTVVVSSVWATQMFLAGLPLMWVVVCVVLGAVGAVGAYSFLPHVAHRIDSFLAGAEGGNVGYQVQKSLEAFYSGGLTGRGPGEGIVKQKLPDSHTDFIFAVVGEELGALACVVMVLLFAFIVFRGFKRVIDETDSFVLYAVVGLLTEFGLQAMVNMGVALNLLPAKGMTLPFISYGGSSMLAICMAMGMVLALTRRRYGVEFSKVTTLRMPVNL